MCSCPRPPSGDVGDGWFVEVHADRSRCDGLNPGRFNSVTPIRTPRCRTQPYGALLVVAISAVYGQLLLRTRGRRESARHSEAPRVTGCFIAR